MKICLDLHRFERKIVFVIVFEQFYKGNVLVTCNFTTGTITFLKICANLQKYWNNAMSNDDLSLKKIDLSHGN